MKIAFVSHVLPPSWSGQSVMIGRILRQISPTFYCLIRTEKIQSDIGRNIEILPSKVFTLIKEPNNIKNYEKSWIINWIRSFYRGICIARIVAREKCDTIIAASGNIIDIPACWWGSIITGTKLIPYLFDDYQYQWADTKIRLIARKMERHVFKNVTKVIVPNEFMKNEIQFRYPVKAFIVRNPCESKTELFDQIEKKEYDLQSEIRIIYTGAIYHVNFDTFQNLIIATSLISENIKIHLYTAQSQDWLKQNGVWGSQLVFHSHSLYADVIEAQRKAHLLFLPLSFNSSIPEVINTSAPGKTAEYLASGTPILAHVPSSSFISWYFRKNNCGYVVDENNITFLKKAIESLLVDEILRKKLVSNAIERAIIDFDPIIAAQAFINAIEED
jgi:glycosyltransferase involved in cell wall biosynthesis